MVKPSRTFAGFLVVVAMLVAIWLLIVPIAVRAPGTNQYKMIRPFSAAIEMSLGKAAADAAIKGEVYGYCGYFPVTMCVRLFLNQSNLKTGDLTRILQITGNVCEHLQTASAAQLGDVAIGRRMDRSTARETLQSYAGCKSARQSLYRLANEGNFQSVENTAVLLFIEAPISPELTTPNSKDKP